MKLHCEQFFVVKDVSPWEVNMSSVVVKLESVRNQVWILLGYN